MNARKTKRRPKKTRVKPAAPPGPSRPTQAFGGLHLRAHIQAILAALAVAAAYSFGMLMVPDVSLGLVNDEVHHYPQIRMFVDGRFEMIPTLPMLPGYHAVIAAVAWAVGDSSLPVARAISWALCFPAVALFFLCARELGKDNRFTLPLVFLLSPIAFPYFFVLHTDIPSVGFLLGALLLTLKRRYQAAGLVAVLAILVRHNNVIWVFFCGLIALGQEGVWAQLAGRDWRPVLRAVARLWLFVLAGLALAAFLVSKGSFTLDEVPWQHPQGRLYWTQIYLLLFTMFFLLLPLHISNLPRIAQMIGRRRLLWALTGAGLLVLYLLTFWVDHRFNGVMLFWRNQFLHFIKGDVVWRVAAFIPMLWAFLSVCATPLQRRAFYWLYPLAVVFLLPSSLIDTRYFIVPVTLFMLVKKRESLPVDLLTLALYAPAAAFLYWRVNQTTIIM